MPDDPTDRAQQIEQAGKARLGEAAWQDNITAISAVYGVPQPNGSRTLSAADQQNLLASPDPVAVVDRAGSEAMLAAMQSDDKDVRDWAEQAYSRKRAEQKKQHAMMKGRVISG
jgi:hypothetical protein